MKRTVFPLYAPADENMVRPILDALQKEGVVVRSPQAAPSKTDALVLFLSENVISQGPEADDFFRLNAGRELVIPVTLDRSTPPEELQNALMARHALDGNKYGPEELAERIAKAVRGEGTNRLPLILSVAAAAILLVVGGILLWKGRSTAPGEGDQDPTSSPTAVPTATPALPDTAAA